MLKNTIPFEDIVSDLNLTEDDRREVDRIKKYYQALVELRELREKSGLSQEELAQKSGVPRATISKIEAGKRNVTLDTLTKLGLALGKNVEIRFI